MTFGTWGSPAHGQTWGEQHRCPDLTRVGPPESDPPGCGGQYRYFPGQSFPSNHTWDWTAPFTGNYVLQVTANCDVPYYDDPTQPSCTVSIDGIECDDDRVTQCAAAIGLTIRVVDRSVHVKHTFDVPVTQEVLNSIELQQRMADMFALQQQPAIVFPLSITPLDCELAENALRPGCQQVAGPGPGGGHRRRRLQTQIGADIDHACPQSSFDTRDTAMRTSCGFQSSDAADPLLQGSCPSLECARALLPLLEDCAEHIAEFARHIGPEAAFYEALGRSEIFNNCLEMDQSAAEMASVEVEFRAPTLQVAEQMIVEHQQMVDAQFLPTAQGGRGQQLCFGNSDASVGDGTRCGGRRQLGADASSSDSCADKDERIRQLTLELKQAKANAMHSLVGEDKSDTRTTTIPPLAPSPNDRGIFIHSKANERASATSAVAMPTEPNQHDIVEVAQPTRSTFPSTRRKKGNVRSTTLASTIPKGPFDHAGVTIRQTHTSSLSPATLRSAKVRADHSFKNGGRSTVKLSSPDLDQRAGPGPHASVRRAQTTGVYLRSASVGVDHSVKACAVNPCELNVTACLNGGTCAELVVEGDGAVPYECICVDGHTGARCEE
eukprot:SAG22_NODE_674_length_7971_cov_12.852261_3_plen_607_part_00